MKHNNTNIIKYVCVLLLLVVFGPVAKAQTAFVLPDTSQVAVWIAQAKHYLSKQQADTSIVLAEQAYTKSIKEHMAVGLAQSQLVLARAYQTKGVYPKALSNYLRSLSEFERHHQVNDVAQIHYEIGGLYFLWEVFDRAAAHLSTASSTFLDVGSSSLYFEAKALLASAYVEQHMVDSAMVHYRIVLEHLRNTQSPQKIPTLKKVANVYKENEMYTLSIEAQEEVLEHYQKNENADEEFATLNNIGFLYKRLKNNEKSLQYFTKALEVGSNNSSYRAVALLNIGVVYQNSGDTDEALSYFLKALEIRIEEGKANEIAMVYNLLATKALSSSDFEDALNYLDKAETIGEQLDDAEILLQTYQIGSRIFQEAGSFEEALWYYKKYIEVRDKLGHTHHAKETEKLSKKNYIEKTEEELKLYLTQEELRDLALKKLILEKEKSEKEASLAKENEALIERQLALEKVDAARKLQLANRMLEAEMKDRQIEALDADKRIRELQLQEQKILDRDRKQEIRILESNNQLLKQQKELEQLNARESQTESRIMIGVVIIIILALVYIFITSLKRSKLNKKLREQNTEISAKNEEVVMQRNQLAKQNGMITDSMVYAGHIQAAVFTEKLIDEVGLDYFVFFRPRDIVSGDFHKIHVIGDKVLVAVVDCTGHGIPGAMLSMLGVSFFNEIISERGVDKASEILEELRKRVKKTLSQDHTKERLSDGMDMALCIIDKSSNVLQYAGAYNPLYIIREGQLNEIKADRMPIGVYPKERPFTNHEIQLKKGDRIYAFSDGIVDQLNHRGMKFLPKRLQALLLSLGDKNIVEQKRQLEAAYELWRGGERQTDDVLVMGIEI